MFPACKFSVNFQYLGNSESLANYRMYWQVLVMSFCAWRIGGKQGVKSLLILGRMHGALCFHCGTVCAAFIVHLIIGKPCTHTDESQAKLLHYFGDWLKIFSFFQRLEDRKSVARWRQQYQAYWYGTSLAIPVIKIVSFLKRGFWGFIIPHVTTANVAAERSWESIDSNQAVPHSILWKKTDPNNSDLTGYGNNPTSQTHIFHTQTGSSVKNLRIDTTGVLYFIIMILSYLPGAAFCPREHMLPLKSVGVAHIFSSWQNVVLYLYLLHLLPAPGTKLVERAGKE